MSEAKLADQPFPGDFLIKGQTFRDYSSQISRKETINSYHQDLQNDDEKAKDLRVKQKSLASEAAHYDRDDAVKIKEELKLLQRRYFCIFCKMDFSNAEDFIGHLESLHPNGSFVLVKRDFDAITPPLLPQHNDNDKSSIASSVEKSERSQPPEESSRSITPIILPEAIQNQIKIEPISEDEEEEECDYRYEHADFHNLSTNKLNSNNHHHHHHHDPTNQDDMSPRLTNDSGDPSHQLMVLNASSRIGDGPGEYLCNVCNAKFVYKNNLKSHLKRHLGIYPYVCFYPSCGKRYQFKCKLNKHIEQAHAKIKNFQCPIPSCPKKYFTRNDLAFHISVTHQERQEIPCTICKKVFNSQKSLQIHDRKFHRMSNVLQQES